MGYTSMELLISACASRTLQPRALNSCTTYLHTHAGHETQIHRVRNVSRTHLFLKVIYHPLYSVNKFVTNKSKLPQDGAQVFPYMW